MKYHPISPDLHCPFCGRTNLVYKRPGQHGDIYRCAVEAGGCERTVIHRRQRGKPECGVAAVLNFGQFGPWRPCLPGGES